MYQLQWLKRSFQDFLGHWKQMETQLSLPWFMGIYGVEIRQWILVLGIL